MTDYIEKKHTFTLPDGTKKRVKFRGRTEKEALAKMNRAIYEFEAGQYLVSSSMTVARYVEQMKKTRQLSDDLSHRLDNHVVANVGSVRVQDLRPAHIDLCLSAVRGTSVSNINKTYCAVSLLCRSLIRDDLILRNPMDKVDKPTGHEGHRRAMNTYEQKIFRQTLQQSLAEGREYDLFWGLIYACGLRPGEVRALAWSNVYFDASALGYPFIRVTNAVKKVTQTVGDPKTDAGLRDVPIPDWILPDLLHLRSISSGLLLFPGKNGGPQTEQCVKRRWQRFFNRMDLAAGAKTYRNKITEHSMIGQDLTPYYLRHTYRTILSEAKVNPLVAEHWIGHSDRRVNDLGYAHLTEQMLRDGYQSLNARFCGGNLTSKDGILREKYGA